MNATDSPWTVEYGVNSTTIITSADSWSLIFRVIGGIIIGINVAGGIVGNSLVLAAVKTQYKLHTRPNYFIGSLAIADLLVCLVVFPLSGILTLFGNSTKWLLSDLIICRLFIILDVTCCTASIFHLFMIAWVRYRKVSSLRPTCRQIELSSILPSIFLVWLAAITLSVAPFFLFPDSAGNFTQNLNSTDVYRLVATTIAFYGPFTAVVFIYIKMARILRSRMRRKTLNSPSPAALHKKNARGNLVALGDRRSSNSSLTPICRMWMIRMKREKRVIRTLGVILGVFFICWFPFFAKEIILPFCESCYLPPLAETIINWLGYSNSSLNPLIYAYTIPDFNQAFKKIIKGIMKKKSVIASSSTPVTKPLYVRPNEAHV